LSGEAWRQLAAARDGGRPTSRDYIDLIFDYFFELRGDRCGRDDPAVVIGIGLMEGRRLAVAAHQKGGDAASRAACNFGMPQPAGFRKSRRLFGLAAKLSLPLLCMVDTPGAFPGAEAEAEGQAWAISSNLSTLMSLPVPVIAAYIGEGGSGGALALGVGDVVLMMENAGLSVISPEGCAAILWRDASRAPEAASMLKMSASDLAGLELVDGIVPEPPGGASHRPEAAAESLKRCVVENLGWLEGLPVPALLERRRRRYRELGFFREGGGAGRGRA
jgi:acetyl-CoA carboxylase carboxyl transferase alpha subunit